MDANDCNEVDVFICEDGIVYGFSFARTISPFRTELYGRAVSDEVVKAEVDCPSDCKVTAVTVVVVVVLVLIIVDVEVVVVVGGMSAEGVLEAGKRFMEEDGETVDEFDATVADDAGEIVGGEVFAAKLALLLLLLLLLDVVF